MGCKSDRVGVSLNDKKRVIIGYVWGALWGHSFLLEVTIIFGGFFNNEIMFFRKLRKKLLEIRVRAINFLRGIVGQVRSADKNFSIRCDSFYYWYFQLVGLIGEFLRFFFKELFLLVYVAFMIFAVVLIFVLGFRVLICLGYRCYLFYGVYLVIKGIFSFFEKYFKDFSP